MYSATVLASLLASAHGFASTGFPTGGVVSSANEEKCFVYSVDPSLLYPFVASLGGLDVTSNVTVTHGLVGNTWQGLQLNITVPIKPQAIVDCGPGDSQRRRQQLPKQRRLHERPVHAGELFDSLSV